MAKYTTSLTVSLTPETAEEIYQAALETGVGPSVMGRKLIEDGLAMRQLSRSAEFLRDKVEDDWILLSSGTGRIHPEGER